ncbi:TIGR01777 family oxidoreductase [bacterium]|nr:TIGR01777 family oxidoreductase [candidate division CSSED10-310 bacterium]
MGKLVIAGGSGFIGRHLIRSLKDNGLEMIVLTRSEGSRSRDPDYRDVRFVQWTADDPDWINELAGADAVVNLAGKPIGSGPWTNRSKSLIMSSRVDTVRTLVNAIQSVSSPPRCYIQASAVGFYGTHTTMNVTENDGPGQGFLADVCRQWESGIIPLNTLGIRSVCLRFGIVLGIHDGFYRRMACLVRHFMGTIIGSGQNWISWIHYQDVVKIIRRAITDAGMTGAYNATAPQPIQNGPFMHTLAQTWSRPLLPSPPLFVLRMTLGDMLDELILASHHVVPHRLLQSAFTFHYSNCGNALLQLREECRRRKHPISCPKNPQ